MRVLFIEPYPTEGPSSRYRVEQYIPYLKSKGIDCVVRPFASSEFYRVLYKRKCYFKKICYFLQSSKKRLGDLFRAFKSDIIFIHLEAFPFGPPLFEWFLSKFHKKIIYDLDDAIYMRVSSPANRIFKFLKHPAKLKKIIKISDHIITCNRHLADYAEEFNHSITIIPTSLDIEKFIIKKNVDNNTITIGWIGSHSTASYLSLLKNVFLELGRKFQFNLKIIGAGQCDLGISSGNIKVSYLNWNLDDEIEQFQSLDIGVYPLPENEWTLGKTGFKTIQYMSVGVPCVVSRVGTNKEIVQDGVNGFLAGSEKEWIEKISALIENSKLRAKIGFAGRKTVEKKYSLQKNAEKILRVLEKVNKKEFRADNGLNIMELITDLDIGGTPTVLTNLIQKLDRNRYSLTVCSLKKRNRLSMADEIEKEGIRVFFLNASKLNSPVIFYRLYLLLKDENTDILHTWLFHANILGRLAGRRAKVPRIISSELAIDLRKDLMRVLLDRFTARFADDIITNAEAVRQRLLSRERIPSSKIRIIYNSVDLDKFRFETPRVSLRQALGLNAEHKVIVTVARLDPVKGHKYLFKAIAQVIKHFPDIRLLLVGDGDSKTQLIRYCRSLRLQKNIIFLGVRRDIWNILSIADLFVLPSIEEGMPGSILEAMAMERVVIATRVGGVREIIMQGKDGILVPSRDAEAISKEIEKLLAGSREIHERIGRAARLKAEEKFSLLDMVKKIEELYNDLVKKEKSK